MNRSQAPCGQFLVTTLRSRNAITNKADRSRKRPSGSTVCAPPPGPSTAPLSLPLPPDDANLLNYRTSKATLTVFRLGRRLCLCYVHYLVLRVITVLSWRKSRSRYRILCFLEMKYLSQTWLTWVSKIYCSMYNTSLRPERTESQ